LLTALAGVAGCAGHAQFESLPAAGPARVELSDTPFYPQTEHHCGPAALATVLGAAGRTATPDALASEVYLPGRQGALQPELVAAARARKLLVYETGPALDDVLAEVAAGRPALVLQQLGLGPWPNWHYAVVIGYDRDRDRVLLRSGGDAREELRSAVFASTWDRGGRWAIVLIEPGQLPARADLARYMRAAAALEATAGEAAAAAYRTAAVHWPGESLPLLGLGNLAATRGDWPEAERQYRAALATQPGAAAALNNRAEALVRMGCVDAARRALNEGAARVAVDDPLRPLLHETIRTLPSSGKTQPAACDEFAVR
jgi:tetratricopeptide (TPR) repeat protein